MDLHLPAGDFHLLDDQPKQGLLLVEVEDVDPGKSALGEGGQSEVKLTGLGQFVLLRGERVSPRGQV